VATAENGDLCTTRMFVDDTVAVGGTPPRIEDEGGRRRPNGAGTFSPTVVVSAVSDGVNSYGCETGPLTGPSCTWPMGR
jgi:hypothetical protein